MKTNKPKSYRANKLSTGLTLVELIVYVGVFSVVSVFLTGVVITSLKIQDKNVSSNEVTSQLNLALQTTQRLVREASLIENVFEGKDIAPIYENGVLTNPCTSAYCGVQLRMEDSTLDPTIIRADQSTKRVYLKQGDQSEAPLTNDRVTVDTLTFTKNEIPGAHATLQVNATISFIGALPGTKSARTIVGRVNAATFDSDLIPNVDNQFSVGQSTARWKDARFSGNVTVGGSLGVGTTSPGTTLDVNGIGTTIRAQDLSATGLPALAVQNANQQWLIRTDGSDTDQFNIRDGTLGQTRLTPLEMSVLGRAIPQPIYIFSVKAVVIM